MLTKYFIPLLAVCALQAIAHAKYVPKDAEDLMNKFNELKTESSDIYWAGNKLIWTAYKEEVRTLIDWGHVEFVDALMFEPKVMIKDTVDEINWQVEEAQASLNINASACLGEDMDELESTVTKLQRDLHEVVTTTAGKTTINVENVSKTFENLYGLFNTFESDFIQCYENENINCMEVILADIIVFQEHVASRSKELAAAVRNYTLLQRIIYMPNDANNKRIFAYNSAQTLRSIITKCIDDTIHGRITTTPASFIIKT